MDAIISREWLQLQESARKASILNAESILSRTLKDKITSKYDLSSSQYATETISIAQSIKNKRKANQNYLQGKDKVGSANYYSSK